MAFCTHCGHPVGSDDSFCSGCGTRLAKPDTKTDNEPPVSEQSFGQGIPTPPPSENKKQEPEEPLAYVATPPPPSPAPTKTPVRQASPTQQAPPQPVQSRTVKQEAVRRPPPRHPGRTKLSFLTIVLAVAWLVYSSGLAGALAGSYPMDIDHFVSQADWISFGLMIGLPLGISILQPVLDVILVPIQWIRFRIPRFFLVGMGLVAPFATAWWLYNVVGYRNYEFLHMTLIFGTVASYVLLRTPARYSA